MTIPQQKSVPGLSGKRFSVRYRITGAEEEAREKAEGVCYEQTVEFPADLTPRGDISDQIVGRIEQFDNRNDGTWNVTISYAEDIAGHELPQLLNVIFGNSSMTPGVRVETLDDRTDLFAAFRGPRFGISGIRELLGVQDRSLLMTALKPMGLTNEHLSKIAYECALGGMDIVKDDHGLANQSITSFEDRVYRCTEAVARANTETGRRSVYAPNVTGPAAEMRKRAHFAKRAGAGALLVIPGLSGFDTMRELADDDDLALPIVSHPAFSGSFVTSRDNGISHYALYGQIQRLAGADASIYPNFGGRFTFTQTECEYIAAGCVDPFAGMPPIFPTPGGGMNMSNLAQMQSVYGRDVIYLMGGGLHRYSDSLVRNVQALRNLIGASE